MKSITVLDAIDLPAVDVETIEVRSLYEALCRVTDGRKARGRRYEAALLLVLLILAKMAGMKSILGVADWVQCRGEWLRTALPWRGRRFPCANTYTYLCSQLDVDELNECAGDFFARLTAAQVEAQVSVAGSEAPAEDREAESGKPRGQEHLALDGKSLRGSRRAGAEAKEAQSVLGLYNSTQSYMVRQVPITGRGHERTAAIDLLSQVDLRGTVVSADALHTQVKWCQQVLRQGGDYLVIAKANQSTLRSDIALLFSEDPRPWLPEAQAIQTNKGHGRMEVRQLRVSSQLNDYLASTWPGVQQVFRLERRVLRNGKLTTEWVYGMTSLPASLLPPDQLLALVRRHWQIENRSHWRRDVTLGEDDCKVASGQAPQVLAALNNIVLAIVYFIGAPNLARQLRRFDALPDEALALLMQPL
jgi:predicted transposase YbfD/YdcC